MHDKHLKFEGFQSNVHVQSRLVDDLKHICLLNKIINCKYFSIEVSVSVFFFFLSWLFPFCFVLVDLSRQAQEFSETCSSSLNET